VLLPAKYNRHGPKLLARSFPEGLLIAGNPKDLPIDPGASDGVPFGHAVGGLPLRPALPDHGGGIEIHVPGQIEVPVVNGIETEGKEKARNVERRKEKWIRRKRWRSSVKRFGFG